MAACPGTRSTRGGRCPTDRTVTIKTQADVDRLAGCPQVGGLRLQTGVPVNLTSLRTLETVAGDLVVGPTIGLDELELLELSEVGGAIHVTANNSLRGLFLPRLVRAGRLSVEANVALTSFAMPRLEAVTGSVVITDNPGLEQVGLPVLATIGRDLVVAGNPRLAQVELVRLASVTEVRIDGNRALPADQVEVLRARATAAR